MAEGNDPRPIVQMSTTVSFTYNGTTQEMKLVRVGNIVTAYVPELASISMSGWSNLVLATIPSGYVPPITFRFPVVTDVSNLFMTAHDNSNLFLNNRSSSAITTSIMASCYTWLVN